MSIKIIRAGILDTFQDIGRYGFRHLGINPGGAMDQYSAQLANIIAANDKNDAVIEIHFPGSVFLFEEAGAIVITGADFSPAIDDNAVELNKPIRVTQSSTLRFKRPVTGARCYMAVTGGFDIHKWAGSYSTNLKAKTGGFQGRSLVRDDVIHVRNKQLYLDAKMTVALNHASYAGYFYALDFSSDEFFFIHGPEWDMLTDESKSLLEKEPFTIQLSSDRMGYRLSGSALKRKQEMELVSSPVAFGTIQLLPDGQLIILMADHQTTGGYPRIGGVISAHLPVLAQKKPGDHLAFSACSTIALAEEYYRQQQEYLSTLEKEIQERLVEK